MPFLINLLLVPLFVFALSLVVPVNTYAHPETAVIKMTKNGFEPSEIKVDINSTVIFKNEDDKPRWPASNVHPTHDLYPEFDPRGPIEPDKEWIFKPKNPGTWKYHDHLLPHLRGVLTVTGEKDEDVQAQSDKISQPQEVDKKQSWLDGLKGFASKIFSYFTGIFKGKDNGGGQLDLKSVSPQGQLKALEDFSKKNGAQSVWELVKTTFKGEGGSSGNIHDLAHLSGKLIYDEKGFEGLGVCSPEFSFGCYHGFLDTAFAKSLDDLQKAQDACSKLGNGGPSASCIHGIGHGIASFHSTNDIKKSLGSCRKLTSGREFCFDGVFMEYVRSAPESFYKTDNPYFPCDELERNFGYTYSFACGRNQPPLLMGRFKKGFDEVAQICLSSKSKPFKDACIDALGFAIASGADPQQIISGCVKIGIPEYVLRCSKAAAGELVFQEVPGWEMKSQDICNSIGQGREECLGHIENLVKEYSRKKKTSFPTLKDGEDENIYIRAQLKKCYETGGRDSCYKDVADVLYSQFGLSKMLNLLKTNENYPEVYARCHEVTHYLSRSEYAKQKNIAGVYQVCDSTCHGGCYHGTMEAYLKEKQLKAESVAEHFTKVCGKIDDYQKPLEYYECLHGLGHAAMFVTEMELFESLKLCDSLNDQAYRERCYTGVFMENSSSSTSFDHASKYIKKEDPYYPCNAIDEKYQSLCWQYQSSYFSIISNQDFGKVAQMCLNVPQQYQEKCFRTIGTNQVGFTRDLGVMKQNCDLMPGVYFQNICVAGVIASLSYRFVGDMQKMVDFCSIINSQNQESCFKQIGTSLLDWSTDKNLAAQNCNIIQDTQARSWCMGSL